jgi:hypothetical protein
MRALAPTDVPVAIDGNGVELRMTDVGEMTASFITLARGTDLGPALAGLEHDRCPCPHWGYMISGRLLMRTADGDQVYEAGNAFYWGPGHVPVALEDCSYVDFSPTEEFAAVIRHITGAGAA